MNTLNTDRKFTVMLSAYQSSNSELENLIDTEKLHHFIEHHCHVHAIRIVGVYHGGAEQSFVVHTNSTNTLHQLKIHALEVHNQECVLISNNRKREIKLHDSDGVNVLIGTHFAQHHSAPKGANSYSILNGRDYWTVV